MTQYIQSYSVHVTLTCLNSVAYPEQQGQPITQYETLTPKPHLKKDTAHFHKCQLGFTNIVLVTVTAIKHYLYYIVFIQPTCTGKAIHCCLNAAAFWLQQAIMDYILTFPLMVPLLCGLPTQWSVLNMVTVSNFTSIFVFIFCI